MKNIRNPHIIISEVVLDSIRKILFTLDLYILMRKAGKQGGSNYNYKIN